MATKEQKELRNFLKDMDKELEVSINNMIDKQEKLVDAIMKAETDAERAMFKRRYDMLSNSLDDELQAYQDFYLENLDNLAEADKDSMKKMVRARLEVFKTFQTDVEKTEEVIEKATKGTTASILMSLDDLRDAVVAFDVANISDKIGDSTQSYIEVLRGMKQQLSLSKDEWAQYGKDVGGIVEDLGYNMSRTEVMDLSAKALGYGIKDEKQLVRYTKAMGKLQLALDIDASGLEGLITASQRLGDNADSLNRFGDSMKALNDAKLLDNKSNDVVAKNIDELSGTLRLSADGDTDKYNKFLQQAMSREAALSKMHLDGTVSKALQTIGNADDIELGQISAQGLIDASYVKQLMQEDQAAAYDYVYQNMMNNVDNMKLNKEYRDFYGITDENWADVRQAAKNSNQYYENARATDSAIANSKGAMDSFIESTPMKGLWDRLTNRFTATDSSATIGDLMGAAGVDLSDIRMTIIGAAAMQKINFGSLFSGVKTQGLRILGSFGSSSGTILSTLRSGLSGSLTTMTSVGGKAITSMIDLVGGSASKIFGFLGTAAGKLVAVLGIAIDAVSGAFNAQEWTGQTTLGSVASSAIGGALGGTGPGLMDDGGIGEKLWNIGSGVLKGAAAGGAVGAAFGGIGAVPGAIAGAIAGGIGSAIGGKTIARGIYSLGGGEVKGFAGGLSSVPFDGFPAFLHAGESVLTASQASALRSTSADGGISITDSETAEQMAADIHELLNTTESYNKKSLMYDESMSESLDGGASSGSLGDLFGGASPYSNAGNAARRGIAKSLGGSSGGSKGGILGSIFSKIKGVLGLGGSGSTGGSSSSYGGFGGSFGSANASISTGNNARDTWDFLTGNGFTPIAAAGIMGNLQQESGFDPLITEKGYPGWQTLRDVKFGGAGIAQWTDPGRCDRFDEYMASNGLDPHALHSQLSFMLFEANKWYSGAVSAVNAATSPTDAAIAWEKGYEGAGNPQMSNRTSAAEAFYQKFANQYALGTPYVPEDQLAFIHEGEAIIPKENNPYNIPDYNLINEDDSLMVINAKMEAARKARLASLGGSSNSPSDFLGSSASDSEGLIVSGMKSQLNSVLNKTAKPVIDTVSRLVNTTKAMTVLVNAATQAQSQSQSSGSEDIVDTIKWMVDRLEVKNDEIIKALLDSGFQSPAVPGGIVNKPAAPSISPLLDVAFKF